MSMVTGIVINCNFIFLTLLTDYGYNCRVQNQLKVSQPNTQITNVTGTHLKWTKNSQVERLLFSSNTQMSFIPIGYSKFFVNLNNIWIEGSPIETITKTDFEAPGNINILGVVKTHLKFIDNEIFSDLVELEQLYLRNNQIERIHEDSLSKLKKLKVLELSGNKLSYLPEKLFDNCRNIQEIYFNDNKIKIIESKVFVGLTRVVKIELFRNLCV